MTTSTSAGVTGAGPAPRRALALALVLGVVAAVAGCGDRPVRPATHAAASTDRAAPSTTAPPSSSTTPSTAVTVTATAPTVTVPATLAARAIRSTVQQGGARFRSDAVVPGGQTLARREGVVDWAAARGSARSLADQGLYTAGPSTGLVLVARTWLTGPSTVEQAVEGGRVSGQAKPVLGGVARFVGLNATGDGSGAPALEAALAEAVGSGPLLSRGAEQVDGREAQHYVTTSRAGATDLWLDTRGRIVRLQVRGEGGPAYSVLTFTAFGAGLPVDPPPTTG